jgi:catechol 2,3-dioxygenase-like lactoylglutathione lyase family enzyme
VLYEGIDRAILPVSDMAAACAPFERLGLIVSPERQPKGRGIRVRAVPIGGPDNLFEVHFVSSSDEGGPGWDAFASAADKGLSTIVLRVTDFQATLAALGNHGITPEETQTVVNADGSKRSELAVLPEMPDAGIRIRLIQHYQSGAEIFAEHTGGKQHATPLKRLDHLVAVAPDLERACTFWDEVLGIPTVGEVISPTVVARQLRIGDAMLELLGPATPDSPIRQRPPGLISVFSVEVPNLDATIAHAEAAGFTVADRRIGALPGTIVATIPAAQTSGVNVQLLQYT